MGRPSRTNNILIFSEVLFVSYHIKIFLIIYMKIEVLTKCRYPKNIYVAIL